MIYIASSLGQKNGGTWPLIEDTAFKGGFQVRADNVGRDAIDSLCRKQGMLCLTQDSSTIWVLNSDLIGWSKLTDTVLPQATSTTAGTMSAADKLKLAGISSGAAVAAVTASAPVVSSGGTTPIISMAAASASTNGYLSATDWNTFNNKANSGGGSGSVTGVTATAPVVSSGGAAPVISMAAATSSVNGYLKATDWVLFNSKGAGNVTNVSGTGTASGLTLSGSVNTSGSLTLSGEVTSVSTVDAFQMDALGIGAVAPPSGELRVLGEITAFYSDERLKSVTGNITNALSKVESLNGITYVGNALAREFGFTSDEEQIGLLASEVEAVAPQVVTAAPFDIEIDEAGNEFSKSGQHYMTVRYERLVPMLVEAIKELSTRLSSAEDKLSQL